MGRSSRRAVRHDLQRGAAGGCQQVEGRLSLRRPVGGLLSGGCQSSPLSRRATRRPRPQEEARRRAEARLASLFRTDAASLGLHGSVADCQLGCVAVEDGSDSDASLNLGAAGGVVPSDRPAGAGAAPRPPSQASGAGSTQSGDRHRRRSSARGDSQRRSGAGATGDSQCRPAARGASPRNSTVEANTRCPSTAAQSWSDLRPAAGAPSAAGASGCAGATGGDWTAPRRPTSASAPLASPDEGEGLTPGPGGGVRIEDLLDTVLGEVQTQLEQLTAGGTLVCDEERDALVALYRRQPPPRSGEDCPLLQRLRTGCGGGGGGRGDDGAAKSDARRAGGDAEEEGFVLQVCTSSQEDSALEQDPIRFLKMVEAASTAGAGSGTGWLDAAPPPARGGPLRQCDLLTARTGVLRRSPSPPPAPGADVGWLEAAVSPGRWPDWRGGGDILDVLDGPRPRWETGQTAAAAASSRHHC